MIYATFFSVKVCVDPESFSSTWCRY